MSSNKSVVDTIENIINMMEENIEKTIIFNNKLEIMNQKLERMNQTVRDTSEIARSIYMDDDEYDRSRLVEVMSNAIEEETSLYADGNKEHSFNKVILNVDDYEWLVDKATESIHGRSE